MQSPSSVVQVLPYNPAWHRQFESAAASLRALWGDSVLLEHIGSTVVVGLDAKPIIDILAGAESLSIFDISQTELADLGF